jgi:anhydro-N-acetylmuramic acid kinase
VMSGTSLDGVDLAYVRFQKDNYQFELLKTVTLTFPNELLMLLTNCRRLSNNMLIELHHEWSAFVGEEINKHFITKDLKPDYIASHGHTVFHEPKKGYTLQIGSIPVLSEITNCHVIGDFRSLDVSKGGEGAPLVPIGDLLLFPNHNICLNLGGIANISVKTASGISAYDVCPCNLILNYLAQQKGLVYDKGGMFAKTGNFNQKLFDELNSIRYYSIASNPSLGIEIVEEQFFPVLEKYSMSIEDKLHTYCKHIAFQIEQITPMNQTVLVSGGGVYNNFLISCFKEAGLAIEIPSNEIIEFKEALIFAFLGLRKIENKVNVLSSVTGASSDSVAGCLFEVN